jgi:DNA-binding response OmpR family regulator
MAAAESAGGPLRAALVDLGLPGWSGRRVARELQRRWPGLPLLIMTGSADLIDPDEPLEREWARLQKPFTPDALLRRVAELISGADAAGRPPPRAGS